jgi:hypothetical protein
MTVSAPFIHVLVVLTCPGMPVSLVSAARLVRRRGQLRAHARERRGLSRAEATFRRVQHAGEDAQSGSHRIALWPLEMETASRRQSATTRAWGSIGSAEIFAEGTAQSTSKWDVHCAGLARYRQGVVGG